MIRFSTGDKKIFAILAVMLAFFAICLFSVGLPGGFLLDDNVNILENHNLRVSYFDVEKLTYAALSFRDGNGARALPMLSFSLDYWRGEGFDPATFKVTNIAIHGLTVFFLTFFLKHVLLLVKWPVQPASWGALLLAMAWAIHPLQVSSVLYVVQRMQTMSTLFIVLALLAYVSMRQIQLAGGRGRMQGGLCLLAWLLALACKEDALLLPVYTSVLELTVLRFSAAQAAVARGLRQSYAVMVVAALALFAFYILPRYWTWEPYPWRDFSSMERLLTQGRVLAMYIGQIIFPWPDLMKFNYDGYPVSRTLWQPVTTLPALLLLAGLQIWALCWLKKRPLFSFGVLFFFAGHLITSNVMGLELVFEHRNHLPLLGVLLAATDLLLLLISHLKLNKQASAGIFIVIFAALHGATLSRAHIWGDQIRFGEKMAALAPNSYRPWVEWSRAYFSLYTETQDKAYLQQAIDVSEKSFSYVDSYIISNNMILYKSLQGTLAEDDWQRFYNSLRNNLPLWRRQQMMQTLMMNVNNGYITDKDGVLRAFMVLMEIAPPGLSDTIAMGAFAYKLEMPEAAMMFFGIAAQLATGDDPAFKKLLEDLISVGHGDWVGELMEINKNQKANDAQD